MLGAIVPAAGTSSRMGFPKALLHYRGETFLSGILRALDAAGIERRVVVLAPGDDRTPTEVDLSAVQVAVTVDLAAGPIGSIRAGIEALANHPVDGALIWPVDRPHVRVATIQVLLSRFLGRAGDIVVPEYEGRRGHPVVFGKATFRELLEAPDEEGARHVVRRDESRITRVPVDDPAVLEDVNTPGEYRDLVRREDAHRSGDPPPTTP